VLWFAPLDWSQGGFFGAGFAAVVCFDFPLVACSEMAGVKKETDSVAAKSVSERMLANIFMRHSSN